MNDSNRFTRPLCLITAALGASCASVLQDPMSQETHASGVSVTPRLWLAEVAPIDEDVTDKETFSMPMVGATATWSPKSLPRYSFLLTALVGDGDGDVQAGGFEGETDADRFDLELLARYNFPGRGFFVFFGPRLVQWDEKNEIGGAFSKLDWEALILEGGVGLVTDISDDGTHQLFGNLIAGLAFDDWDWESNVFPEESGSSTNITYDINLGYQRTLSESSSFGLRYRAFLIPQDNDFGQENLQVFHGPEIGFTFSF